jgi:hypothetical protein
MLYHPLMQGGITIHLPLLFVAALLMVNTYNWLSTVVVNKSITLKDLSLRVETGLAQTGKGDT